MCLPFFPYSFCCNSLRPTRQAPKCLAWRRAASQSIETSGKVSAPSTFVRPGAPRPCSRQACRLAPWFVISTAPASPPASKNAPAPAGTDRTPASLAASRNRCRWMRTFAAGGGVRQSKYASTNLGFMPSTLKSNAGWRHSNEKPEAATGTAPCQDLTAHPNGASRVKTMSHCSIRLPPMSLYGGSRPWPSSAKTWDRRASTKRRGRTSSSSARVVRT